MSLALYIKKNGKLRMMISLFVVSSLTVGNGNRQKEELFAGFSWIGDMPDEKDEMVLEESDETSDSSEELDQEITRAALEIENQSQHGYPRH